MEDLKAKAKEVLTLDVRMVLSKLNKKGKLTPKSALEAGAFVTAQFMRKFNQVSKENGKRVLSTGEMDQVFKALNEIYDEQFESGFSKLDCDVMEENTMKILRHQKAPDLIKGYFDEVLRQS